VASVDAERATEWRNGVVRFEGTTLEQMVVEMNRYVAKPLVLEDESLRSLEVSGRFRVGDTPGFLYALRERFGVTATEAGGVIRLTASR
jgi:transmembrane sensor